MNILEFLPTLCERGSSASASASASAGAGASASAGAGASVGASAGAGAHDDLAVVGKCWRRYVWPGDR